MADFPLTRASLLVRLRDQQNDAAWAEFIDLYAPLVYGYLRKQGLQEADAADLSQDVLGAVANAVNRLDYDPRAVLSATGCSRLFAANCRIGGGKRARPNPAQRRCHAPVPGAGPRTRCAGDGMGGRVATSAVFLGLRGSPEDRQPCHLARVLEDRGRRSGRQAGGRGSGHDHRRRLFGSQARLRAIARAGPVGARTMRLPAPLESRL